MMNILNGVKANQMMKISKILLCWLLLTGLITSCSGQPKRSVNSCDIAKDVIRYEALIKTDSIKSILSKGNDDCNLRLVDSIYAIFSRNPNKLSFDLLTSVANKSDGYISEYIVEKMGRVYYTKFEPFFNFIYEDFVNKRKNKLENFLIDSWSSIAATNDNSTTAVSKIRKNTQTIVGKQQVDLQNRMKYLNGLLARINAKYLD